MYKQVRDNIYILDFPEERLTSFPFSPSALPLDLQETL